MPTYAKYGEGLDASHISTNLASYERGRTGFFNFIIGDKLNSIPKYTYTGGLTGDDVPENERLGSLATEIIKLNLTKAPIPTPKLEVLSYTRGNEIKKFAGKPSWDSGQIEIDDVVGLDTRMIIMSWFNAAYNIHNGKGGRMKDYQIDCTLIEYTQDYEEIRRWELYGCWISSASTDDADKTSDAARKITATLEYDKAVMVYTAEEDA